MIASRIVQRLLANPRVGSGAVRAYAGSGARGESYTEKQARKGRPVSPHVTIYKFPITSISSIMNRVTGVALSVGEC
jgi:succinate dehydrogenase (ubiquinone) cytochrome b560 subunit